MKYAFHIAAVFSALLLMPDMAYAKATTAPDQANGPGITSSTVLGGPNVSPKETITSIARHTGESSDNTGAILNTLNNEGAAENGRFTARTEADKTLTYSSQFEERRTELMAMGREMERETGMPYSHFSAGQLSTMVSTGSTAGPRAVNRMFEDCPGDTNENGIAGTPVAAFRLITAICQGGTFPQHDAQRLAQSGRFPGCHSCPKTGGTIYSSAKFRSSADGVVLQPGQQCGDAAAVCLRKSVATFAPGVNALRTAMNYSSIRQMVSADVKQWFAAKAGKKQYASQKDIDPELQALLEQTGHKNLLMRASTAQPPNAASENELIFGSIARGFAQGSTGDSVVHDIEGLAGTPNRGQDIYRYVSAANTEATGEQPCYRQGFYPSPRCVAEMSVGSQITLAGASTTERMPSGDQAGLLQGVRTGMETARATVAAIDGRTVTSDAAVGESMQTLAAIFMMPEFQVWLASLDEKYVNETVASVREEMRVMDVKMAANYQKFLDEEAEQNRTYFAQQNAPTVTLRDLFADANLDIQRIGTGQSPFVSVGAIAAANYPVKATLISTDAVK